MRTFLGLLFFAALMALGYERISAPQPKDVPPVESPRLLDDGTCCPSPRP